MKHKTPCRAVLAVAVVLAGCGSAKALRLSAASRALAATRMLRRLPQKERI